MLRNPVSTIITLAARIADEHPRAAQLAYRIRAEARELRAEPVLADAARLSFDNVCLESERYVFSASPQHRADATLIHNKVTAPSC